MPYAAAPFWLNLCSLLAGKIHSVSEYLFGEPKIQKIFIKKLYGGYIRLIAIFSTSSGFNSFLLFLEIHFLVL